MAAREQQERIYRSLYRIRRVEEEIIKVYPTDRIKSPVHLSIGQEGVSVGLCAALRPGDMVFGTYRGHALYLAKGGNLAAMIAELYGKAAGCAKGKGGSMHLVDVAAGFMGTSAVVGTTIPLAAGWALKCRMRGLDAVAAAVFGDGAVEEGVFHETMNFAVLRKLPLVFVCENNLYAIHSRLGARQAADDIVRRAQAYGMPAARVGDSAAEVLAAARKAVAAARAGEGPAFIECRTYRWKEHVGPGEDYDKGYRSAAEARPWRKRDPVRLAAKAVPAKRRRAIEAEVEAEIRAAFEYAERAPVPGPEELLTDAYA